MSLSLSPREVMGEENVEAVPVDKLPPPKVPLQVIIVIMIMIFILISNIMTPKISMNCSLNKLPPAKIVISYRHSLQHNDDGVLVHGVHGHHDHPGRWRSTQEQQLEVSMTLFKIAFLLLQSRSSSSTSSSLLLLFTNNGLFLEIFCLIFGIVGFVKSTS